MSVTNVYHRTRDRIYKMNFSASGETSWSFTAECDGVIYAVESNNVASYSINGGSVTLPFQIINGNVYMVSIVKTVSGSASILNLISRRNITKTSTINVPNYSVGDGRYLYVISNQLLYELDSALFTASNYLGAGLWTTDPNLNTYSLPDISSETDGDAGNILWRSLCFLTINGVNYMFCLADAYPYGGALIASFLNLSDKNFYKPDLINLGYEKIISNSGSVSRVGSLLYNYIDQKILIQLTRGANSGVVLYDILNNSTTSWGLDSVPDNIINRFNVSGYKFRYSFDPVENEYVGPNMRLKLPSENNRNFMGEYCYDSEYIRSTGEVASQFHNNNVIYFYNKNGAIVRAISVGSVDGATGGGFIISDSDLNYICYAPRDTSLIRIIDIDGTNGYAGNLVNVTSDHSGFAGVMKSAYSGLIFTWGKVSTDSRKRLYIINSSVRDSTCEIGYLDFSEDIDDMFTNQIL